MLYQFFNKKITERMLSASGLYSLSFANTKLGWRHNRAFEALHGRAKHADLAFSLSSKHDGTRGDILITTWITKMHAVADTLSAIHQLSSGNTNNGKLKELRGHAKIVFSDFMSKLFHQEIDLKDEDIVFFPDGVVGLRFDITNLKNNSKLPTGIVFADNYLVGLHLYAFTENREEIATARADFDEVFSSIKINKPAMGPE